MKTKNNIPIAHAQVSAQPCAQIHMHTDSMAMPAATREILCLVVRTYVHLRKSTLITPDSERFPLKTTTPIGIEAAIPTKIILPTLTPSPGEENIYVIDP